jgi:ABC-type glycerol-3-phosphate transport system substrate-binding protein
VLTLTNLQGPFLLGAVTLRTPAGVEPWSAYAAAHPSAAHPPVAGAALLRVEAERFSWRSSPSVRALAERNPGLTPYDTRRQLLNVVDGDTWKLGGQEAAWSVTAPADGWYRVVLVAHQRDTDKARTPVFRSLRVDGALPFAEAASLRVRPSPGWADLPLELPDGTGVSVWLAAGSHELSLAVDESRARPILETAEDLLEGIRELTIAVRKITGNSTDPYRDWTITDFLPDAPARLRAWADRLDAARVELRDVVGAGERSREALSLRQSSQILRRLADEPNEIPRSLNRLSEGPGSVGTVLGELLTLVAKQPLTVDALLLAEPGAKLPSPAAGFFRSTWEGVKVFALSFLPQPYVSKDAPKTDLKVWVFRARQYLPVIQSLADATFTPSTGVQVTLSLTSDEGKLILANAAGRSPDVVISSANWAPFDLGIRGALIDLRKQPGFPAVVRRFAPGAFLNYVVEDAVYALPETQDFWVLFYRKDILDSLGLKVPDTWDDVTRMLPVLQRFGMNFYSPLSGAGFKTFLTTAPFIYQFGGELYRQDPVPGGGTQLRAAIDSEESLKGIQLMANLFTLYSLPMQTPVFYDSFRSAKLPIGVANFTEYLKLATAAPEIAGWWSIAPQPGVRNAQGQVVRWAPGSAQAAYAFKTAGPRSDAAWKFLQWWTSAETQGTLEDRLRTSYGAEYLWPSANLEAFAQLPLPPEHRAVILEQWKWMREVAKAPGSYMLEREISNTWNRIVFNGENARSAVDDAEVTINRELSRKLEEFGYMKGGVVVRPFRIPDITTIESWGREP